MKTIRMDVRVNLGWNNLPAQIDVKVDDRLFEIISILQETKGLSERSPKGSLFFRKTGVMSKNSGFGWVNLSTRQHGQDIGMFYGGINEGEKYIDLNELQSEGEHCYKDLIKERS